MYNIIRLTYSLILYFILCIGLASGFVRLSSLFIKGLPISIESQAVIATILIIVFFAYALTGDFYKIAAEELIYKLNKRENTNV